MTVVVGERRRLAAILAADVVGYSRLVGADEDGTLARLRALFRDVVQPTVAAYRGRVFKLMGDAFLAEFPSAVEAVRCALTLQERVERSEPGSAADARIRLRVGLHLGDVVTEGGDLLGDGVNIAARLEGAAEPGGVVVSGAVRDAVRGRVEASFADLGETALKNIDRPVRAYRLAPLGQTDQTPPASARRAASSLSLPDRPSLVVLPFQNMSADPEQQYLADGITEELTTALSRVRWFFVIARNSAFTFRGRAVDVRQVGRELGVRYALEGSIRQSGTRLRVATQLVEAEAGHHVWVDRFDGDLADIFGLQDRVAEAVAGAIEPSLRAAELARSRAKPTGSLDAYDLYLRALPHHYTNTREGSEVALALLRRAAALDPGFAAAKALAAFCHAVGDLQGWARPGDAEEGVRLAREALAVGMDDPGALQHAARVLGLLAFDRDAALDAVERSLALNPNAAETHQTAGYVNNWLCRPEAALCHFARATRLSPLDPGMVHVLTGSAVAHMIAGRHEAALHAAHQALRLQPEWGDAHRNMVAALWILGRREEAAAAARRARELAPGSARVFAERTRRLYVDQAFTEARTRAVREAGLPD